MAAVFLLVVETSLKVPSFSTSFPVAAGALKSMKLLKKNGVFISRTMELLHILLNNY